MKKMALLAALAVLTLSGCTKVAVDLELHEDHTASGSYVVAIASDADDVLGLDTETLFNEALGRPIDAFDSAIVSVYSQGGYDGYLVEFEDRPFDEVSRDLRGMTIKKTDDEEYVVRAAGRDTLSGEYSEWFANSEATLTVTFPGEVLQTNGIVDGTTVSWDLTEFDGDPYARASAHAGLAPLATAVVVTVFIATTFLAALSVVLVGRHRR